MQLTLERWHSTDNETYGFLRRQNSPIKHMCFTLEDGYKEQKVCGKTRIPCGNYKLGLITATPMEQQYNYKYNWHKYGMIWIQEVIGFSNIYFHPGNTHENTLGCILVGENSCPGDGRITTSLKAYKALYQELAPIIAKVKVPKIDKIKDVWLQIIDRDLDL